MKATQLTFFFLEISKTSRGFEVRNSTDLGESLLNLDGFLENSEQTANPGRRSTVIELAIAILLDGHVRSNFHTAVGERIFVAPWRPDMQFDIQQLSAISVPQQQASETVDTISQSHAQNVCSSRSTHDGSQMFG